MRELKFRAWGRDIKKFLYIELKPNAQIKDSEWRYNGYDDWEQYTGLKDKNGKEIYEGDIAKLCGKVAKNKATIYMVVADDFVTGYDLISLEKNKMDVGYMNKTEMRTRYEVIGNIHENPELVKEKEYTLADFVKGRVDKETLDRIARKADELQRKNLSEEMKEPKTSYTEKMILGEEDKAIADKAAKLIARDYGEVLKKLED